MADSTVIDVSKMKVVDLRKELKSRGLSYAGDKAELIARLQAAVSQDSHDEQGEITLESDEIDSDGVLEDEYDKSQSDILEDSAVDTLNEELALAEQLAPVKSATEESKPHKSLKRKITLSTSKDKAVDPTAEEVKEGPKKIVLNRAISVTSAINSNTILQSTEEKAEEPKTASESKIKIATEIDTKTRLEMRAKRFGLPVKISEAERKEARKQRFGQNTATVNSGSKITSTEMSGSLTDNIEKLKQRAQRFGQSVSSIMTDIEKKEKLEKRKAKFGTMK